MRLQPAGRRGEHFDVAALCPGDILSAWDSAETSGWSAQTLPQGPFSLAPLPESWAVAPLSGCEGLSWLLSVQVYALRCSEARGRRVLAE